jgi:hypothetical protein
MSATASQESTRRVKNASPTEPAKLFSLPGTLSKLVVPTVALSAE